MNLNELKKLGRQYDEQRNETVIDSAELTSRLKKLVDTHGVSSVAAVLDKAESTILVYTRYRNSESGCVKQYDLIKAETILNNQ